MSHKDKFIWNLIPVLNVFSFIQYIGAKFRAYNVTTL